MNGEQEAKTEFSLTKRALYRIARLQQELAQRRAPAADEQKVAVIGAACRFPAGIEDPDAFWAFLMAGGDATSDIPPWRWDVDAWYSPEAGAPGKMIVRRGAFLNAPEYFDAAFFGIAPREARMMDPNQRLLLECGWEALENAGYTRAQLARAGTGVYVAANFSEYLAQIPPEALTEYAGSGNAPCMAAGRLAYFLGVNGPAMVVDTACSSALTAVYQAVKQLRQRDVNMALAGASSVYCSPAGFIMASQARMLSPDGRCKTFSQLANGYARGEGGGVLLLKRLDDALRDGDRILAVIDGVAVNQDGASGGLTVPSGPAQQDVIRRALDDAGLAPESIGYIEAHGTGTSLGDPIELGALAQVFGASHSARDPLLIGSVKTNLGHLESAAGMAGLLKAIMALQTGRLPPHLHASPPNTHVPWAQWPLKVTTQETPWPAGRLPRRAGVSSFGFSGTNGHVILSAAPPPAAAASVPDRDCHLFTLSARSEAALAQLKQRCLAALDNTPDGLADICFTAGAGREHFPCRLAVIAGDVPSLIAQLADAGLPAVTLQKRGAPRLAWIFGELSPAWLALHETLFAACAPYRADLERIDALFRADGGESPLSRLREPGRLAAETQFVLQYGFAQLLLSWGLAPEAAAGYGRGEIVAACLSGLMRVEDVAALFARHHGREGDVCFHAPHIPWLACTRRRSPPAGETESVAYWLAAIAADADAAADFRPLQDMEYGLGCGGVFVPQAESAPAGFSPDWRGLMTLLHQLYLSGCDIDWAAFDAAWPRRRVRLPTMPFLRQRYWLDDAAPAQDAAQDDDAPLLATLRTLPRAGRKDAVVDFLRRQAGEALGVPPAELDGALALHAQGFDSLMALRLYHACQQHLSLSLPLEEIVAGESLDVLTEKAWRFMLREHAWLAAE